MDKEKGIYIIKCPECAVIIPLPKNCTMVRCDQCNHSFNPVFNPVYKNIPLEEYTGIKEIDCTSCDNPNSEECRICLEAFESSRTRELNPGNANLIAENKSLKKLFIEMYKESVEHKKSIALLKSRETNLLNRIKELENAK